jgi:hypothetical protein
MKKKIVIGLAMTASLLYFGISCAKKENASIISQSTGSDESVDLNPNPVVPIAPETPVLAETPVEEEIPEVVEEKSKPNLPIFVSIESDTQYKKELLTTFRTIVEVNNNLNLPFLNDIVAKFNQVDQNHYKFTKANSLDKVNFDQKRIDIINSTSTLYQLLVTPNITITYEELYYKLSQITDEINALKIIAENFIDQLNMKPMSQGAKDQIIKGTNQDATKGFIGFQKISEKYAFLKFYKMTNEKDEIMSSDWSLAKKAGYTPPTAVAEAPKDPSLVTLTHDKEYKKQLLANYRTILEMDIHLKLPFLSNIVKGFNTTDKGFYDYSKVRTLDLNLFDKKRIDLINLDSTLYKLLVTPNTNKTYREIDFKLSKILNEINNLKISVNDFNKLIDNSMPSQLSISSKNNLLKGTNTDPTKGFIGFNNVQKKYEEITFTKINSNGSPITAFDWQKEQANGYSPN